MKRISRNFLALFLSDIASRVLGFIATVYIARMLDVESFGLIGYGFAFLTYALLFANPGLTTIGAREIAKDSKNHSIIDDIVGLRLSLSLLILIVCIIGSVLIPGVSTTKQVIIVYLTALIPHAVLLEFVFQGHEEMGPIGVSRFLHYSVYLVLVYVLVQSSTHVLLVPIAFVIGYCVAAVVLVIVASARYRPVSVRFSLRRWRLFLVTAIPVGLATILNQSAFNLPVIILGALFSKAEVGLFFAGFKIVVMLLVVERVSYYLFFPIVSRHYARDPEKLPEIFSFFTRLLLAITIPVTIFGVVFADKVIHFIYGSSFSAATDILRIMLVYFLITPINTLFGYGLIAIDKERRFFKIIVITTIVSVISIVVLAFLFKGIGAAIALAGAEAISILLMYRELRGFVKFSCLRHVVKPLISVAGAIAVLYVVRAWHVIVLLTGGIIVYCIVFYLIGGLSKKDVRYLAEALMRNR